MDGNEENRHLLMHALRPAAGDASFWQCAYQDHGSVVLAFLRHRLGQRQDAEDLLQETFVRAIRAGSFRPGGNLRAYLLATARNLVINRLRRPRLVVSADAESDEGPFAHATDEAASPEQRAALGAFRDRLTEILSTMSDAHRRAFHLGVVEQRSYSEIARRTGWSLAQVKVNIYRARRRVIDDLGEVLPDAGWRHT